MKSKVLTRGLKTQGHKYFLWNLRPSWPPTNNKKENLHKICFPHAALKATKVNLSHKCR
ncbi:hypothetical protein F511_40896 [Dorcoceras hygrometricum]|uniref:Uncharacterized protein n=1 Tax=Dorcoceras hygrometricum TaxID=472368 RepID=A0A2Z7CL02_9LAMI|nr:hypothetical protein F511_40896 [Dorcoceras hygrometricum]